MQGRSEAMQSHVIWGEVERSSESSSSNNHGSRESTAEQLRNLQGPGSRAKAEQLLDRNRASALHGGVLDHVIFKDVSNSHSSDKEGESTSGDKDDRDEELNSNGKALGEIKEAETDEEPGIGSGDPGAPEAVWSIGSEDHATGQCSPCRFAVSGRGCSKGKDCSFCHLSHSKSAFARPCKSKRIRCKKFVKSLVSLSKTDPERVAQAVGTVTTETPYLQTMIRRRIPHIEQLLAAEDAGRFGGACGSDGASRKKKNVVSL